MLVLCQNLGRRYTFHCLRKSKRRSKWLGFLVNVRFRSALDLTLNQRSRSSKVAASSDLADEDSGGESGLRLSFVLVVSVIPAIISLSDSSLATFSIPNR